MADRSGRPLRQITVAGAGRCPKCKSRNVLLRTPWWSCWDCGHQWGATNQETVAAVDEAKKIEAERRARSDIEIKVRPPA